MKITSKGEAPLDIETRLEQLERKLDRLRGLYESFFLGVERAPPNIPRRELNRLILEMQQERINNASMRFRFQAVVQRWVLMTAYWNRTLREIEAGTYRRDVARTQRHMAERGGAITEQEAVAMGIPLKRAKAFVERQQRLVASRAARAGASNPAANPAAASAAASAAPAPAPPRPEAIPGISDDDLQSVYQRYVKTHQEAKDPKPAMTLEKMRERLRTQIPRILADKNCSRVKLDVAVEDGKVRLKAWPVKE